METSLLWAILALNIVIALIVLLARSYVQEKAKNQATKEDIAEITALVKATEFQFQVQLQRQTQIADLHSKTAQLIFEIDRVLDEMADRYGLEALQTGAVPDEEWNTLIKLTYEMNLLLAQLYIAMPDSIYRDVMVAIPERVEQWKNLRISILNGLKRANYPSSELVGIEYLRTISAPKRTHPKTSVQRDANG